MPPEIEKRGRFTVRKPFSRGGLSITKRGRQKVTLLVLHKNVRLFVYSRMHFEKLMNA